MIKKYAVKTESGSYYYIEDHSHLFGYPTWFIELKGRRFFIVALALSTMLHDENIIPIHKVNSIEQFKGMIFFSPKQIHQPDYHSLRTAGKTNFVSEIIQFK